MSQDPPSLPERLRIVYELTTRLTSALTLEEMFEAALDALMTGVRIDRASLLLFDAEGVMRFRMWRGLSDGYRRAVDGHSPWTPEEKNARPICVGDAEQDESLAELRAVLRREGIRALAFFPLVCKGRLIGKFMLYADRPRSWTDDEIAFVENVAANAAFTVELTRTERTLREANSKLRSLAEHVPAGILFDSADGEIQYSNDRFSSLFELPSSGELRGRDYPEVAGEVRHLLKKPEAFLEAVDRLRSSGQSDSGREIELRDGRTFSQDYVPMREDDQVVGHLWAYTDVTERKRFEQQLIRAQRMDSLGALAGSVAHDFNNLLTPILGYGEILRKQIDQGEEPRIALADELIRAGHRAAEVTRQLLAFARRQPTSPKNLDLSKFVQGSLDLSRRLLGPEVELVFVDRSRQPFVEADPTQLQQILINLIANARDAMPEGGELRLELYEKLVPQRGPRDESELESGDYVVLAAQDNGCGMDEVTLRRIFEPFFSTKAKGRGTGLGLSTCYGIIRQCGGDIQVESAVGAGTIFRIFLPRHQRRDPTSGSFLPVARPRQGSSTILVVDDEPDVRRVLEEMFRHHGYEVLQAEDGLAALDVLKTSAGAVDLILSDVLMPHMGGRELLGRVREAYPELPVVLMSGFPDSTDLDRKIPFLAKPIRADDALETLTLILGPRRPETRRPTAG